jgi:DNA-binding SARP family transcriptional activator/TolB-like protein
VLKLHVFGSVYVERDGTPLDGAAGQRRVLALLTLLAVARGAGMSRDRLLGILWPEADGERARHSLTQALYNARRALGDDDLFLAGNDIRLNPDGLTSDVGEFMAAIERGDDAAAVSEYQGPFLDGFFVSGSPEFEQWAATHRAQLSADAARALDRLAAAAESRGEMSEVVELRRRRVALDPLDSGAAVDLMTALAATGDVAGAIRHAQLHETLLSQQLDLPPDAHVVAFANQLKDAPPRRASAASPDRNATRASGSGSTAVNEAFRVAAPVARQPRPERRRTAWPSARWIAIGAAVAGVAGALGLAVFRGRTGAAVAAAAAPSGPSSVMVAPFRVAGADPSLSYLRDGLVELLSVRLGGDPARPTVDAGLVLSRWRGAGLTDSQDRPHTEAVRMAERLGAQTVVVGSVVGSPTSILVTASLVGVADGLVRANETVRGPADSLLAMVDQLAVRLLAADAGEGERLGADRTPPLPSLKAYLGGQAAYRQGRFAEAVRLYERALDADSTFALAAFRLSMAADRLNVAEQHDRALAAAWKYRASLNARDQAHLVAFAGPRYPAPSSEAEQLAAWERAAALAPDRAEVWQELGERFFYDGPVMGAPSWPERASSAFRRALALDPNASMARVHLILLAARSRDTVTLGRLASRAALADSVGGLSPFLSWRVALAREDAGALRSARESLAEADATNLRWIAMSSLFDAVGPQDGERALRLVRARANRAADELDVLLAQHSFALNQGRPILALDITEQLQEIQPGTRAHLRLRVLDALYAEGDREAAERAALELARSASGSFGGASGEAVRLADACVLEQWRVSRGQRKDAHQVIARLRAASPLLVTVPVATPPLVCAEILDASLAVATREPNAYAKVLRLDSLMLTGPAVSDAATYANIAIARLYGRLGDSRAALAVIRRRGYMSGWPRYLASARREESRLALAEGDSVAAADVYRRYMALRQDAEPEFRRPRP